MSWKRFEFFERRGRIVGEDVRGETAGSLIGFEKFGMVAGDGFFVSAHDAVVAARERAGPGFVRAEFFVVIEHLAGQRKQSELRFAARKACFLEDLCARFFKSKEQAGGEGAGGVVGNFVSACDGDRHSTKGTRDGSRNARGGGVAFDTEDLALKGRDAEPVKGL